MKEKENVAFVTGISPKFSHNFQVFFNSAESMFFFFCDRALVDKSFGNVLFLPSFLNFCLSFPELGTRANCRDKVTFFAALSLNSLG